jgi:hypothetical protein
MTPTPEQLAKLPLATLAARIRVHLQRMEQDPKINVAKVGHRMGLQPYFLSWASRNGRFVGIRYVSFQGNTNLTREQAAQYLAWLDAGNNGKHHQAGVDR